MRSRTVDTFATSRSEPRIARRHRGRHISAPQRDDRRLDGSLLGRRGRALDDRNGGRLHHARAYRVSSRPVTTTAITVRGLRKSYGDLEAVKGIDLEVATGEVFALLGPNGAGKSTTVEILEGHRERTSGEVLVLGHDPASGGNALRARIGIVLQEQTLEPYLTVAEAIEMYRGYYPAPLPLDEIIEIVGLEQKRDERVKRLSGGQQRRLDVAIGLAGNPDLLFLDEPTTGFDPGARRSMWKAIENLAQLGKTILLTTHYMEEAQVLARRVAIIVGGEIVAEGAPETLGGRADAPTLISFRVPAGAPRFHPSIGATPRGNGWVISTQAPTAALHALTGWAMAHEIELLDLAVARPTLEDTYLALTGEGPVETEEEA